MLNTEVIEQDMPVLTGEIVSPHQPEWDLARRAWNLAVDQRPAYVALPATAEDVVAVVAFARRHGLKLAPQGTGHNAAPIASLEQTVLVSTQQMRGVEIDPVAQTARVQAGTLWLEVTEASTPHGLFPLSGSSPDVGVVGYTLGGGLSWLARKHGLAADSVTAIEIVTPAGELVRATAEEHAELFWALRGGSGNFGVVTAMEFRLYPYAEAFGGFLLFPYERHAEVLRAWRDWTRTAPEEITTSFRIMHLPPLPELPPFLSGRSVVLIDGAYAGDAAAGAAALAPLRALGPEMDTFAPVTPAALSRIHMDPEEPMPFSGGGTLLGATDDEMLEVFAAGVRPGSPLMFAELRHLGGAVAREPEHAGALGSIPGEYLVYAGGAVMAPELAPAVGAALDGFIAGLANWKHDRMYMNFAEEATDPVAFFGEERLARLRAVRATVDPDRVMVASHVI
jgi:FAD/FMN-containing dehydrogenase